MSLRTRPGRWTARTVGDAQRILFCLPYAGGSANVYQEWPLEIHGAAVIPLQLPGRGNRFSEPPHHDMRALVDDLLTGVRTYLDRPFAIFGHSMGARIAYEVACALLERGWPLPERIIAAGSPPPHLGPPPA
ncbi:thioesterase II family protein, partial [Nonomuraea diastatica]